jgi:hypothetical protein
MEQYTLGYSAIRALRKAAHQHGASRAELAAIERFEDFRAESVDVERIRPLAKLAGIEAALPTAPSLLPRELAALLEEECARRASRR